MKTIYKRICIFLVVLLVTLSFSGGVLAQKQVLTNNEEKYERDVNFIKSMQCASKENISELTDELNYFLDEFNKYLERRIKVDDIENLNINEQQKYRQEYIYDYMRYAIKNNIVKDIKIETIGIIENASSEELLESRSFTVSILRVQWFIGAALLFPIFPYTAAFLEHSLDDDPDTITANSNSTISNIIKNTDVYETEMDSFKSQLDQVAGDYYSEWGSMSLTSSSSTTDLYLALHNVGYLMAAEKIGGDWDIYIWIYDTYDFEYWNFDDVSSVPEAFVTLINNYAAASMELGAIVAYNINIYIVDQY